MTILPTRIRFKRLRPEAVTPTYAHKGDSGMDLVAIGWRLHDDAPDRFRTETCKLLLGERVLFHTGLAIQVPIGLELQIRPRSGLSLKQGLHIVWGTCDALYNGPVGVTAIALQDDVMEPIVVEMGTKVAQGVIAPVIRAQLEEVDELEDSERGANGYGSSGMGPVVQSGSAVKATLDGLVYVHSGGK